MRSLLTVRDGSALAYSAQNAFELIKPEMALVEDEFARQASSNIQVISYLGEYLRASGGKRVRPALLILSAYAAGGEGSSESSIRLATVMEMLHTATLVHDDIIDNADIRRSRPSVNARFGNQAAVLMGDWLYMSAFQTSLKERSLEILDILTRLTRKMTEGELIQLTMLRRADITEDEYFDVLKRKTAYLFSGCCEIGAILAGAGDKVRAAMRDYGMDLGVAFQLADDILDVTGDEKALGKAAAADLLEGKVTLPLIMLRTADPAMGRHIEDVMKAGAYPDGLKEKITRRLIETGIIETVRRRASLVAESARKNLEVLPETEYSLALDALPGYVITRGS